MSTGPEPEALYQEADRLLKKWWNYRDKETLADARQEMVLAGLQGKDMRNALFVLMRRELRNAERLKLYGDVSTVTKRKSERRP